MNPYFTIYCPIHTPEYADMAQVALASIECQTFKNFETIVIVNDTGIPDWATGERFLMDTVGLGGRRIIAGRFGTLAAAANAAISLARGKYIVRLDADDEFTDDALWSYVRAIEQNGVMCVAVEGHWNGGSEVQGGGLVLPVHDLCECGGYDADRPLGDGAKIIQKLELTGAVLRTPEPVYLVHRHDRSMTCP